MVSDIYIYMGLNEGIALGKKCKWKGTIWKIWC
jgi:hypothetical protein